MSTYPFGLRGDPFVPPATLSAKEASRLIRRRVRACNGDGGLLYPIETCDAIHRLAHGVPDAVLALAGRALAVAAAAGARAVSPAHVKQAAHDGTAAAPSVPQATAPEIAPAKKDAAPESSAAAPEAEAEPETEPEDEATPASEPGPEYEQASQPAIGALDEDDDLPPFRPASMALPTRPSEDLPEEAREWVSRFISGTPTGATPAPTAESEPPRKAAARKPAKSKAPAAAPRRSLEPEPEVEGVYAAASPPRGIRRRPAGRKQGSNRMLIGVLGIVAMLAVVLRYSTPRHLATPDSQSSRPARTSARAIEPSTPRAPVIKVAPSEPRGEVVQLQEAPPMTPGEGQSTAEPGRLKRVGPELSPETGSEALAPAEPPKPAARFGLEVASFIFEERARQERDRLAAAGLRARVVTTLEFGSRVYRVVIGGYPQPAAAERAADSLLSNGVVLQARVVTTGGAH